MATHEDAMLMVEILRWAEESGAMKATRHLMAESPQGPVERPATDSDVLKLLIFGETVGTFVKQGVLDRELVHDLWAVGWMWGLVGPAALAHREQMGEPRLWENLEALATG